MTCGYRARRPSKRAVTRPGYPLANRSPSEESVAELRKRARTNLGCADICDATGRVLSRHTGYDADLTRAMLEACAAACNACADECARHADTHEHFRVCADACRRCKQACRDLVTALG